MAKHDNPYVRIQTPDDLGYLVHTHRKNKQLTLETFSELSHVSMQFLSASGQKTHPYCYINILPSIVCVTMPLYFASNEA